MGFFSSKTRWQKVTIATSCWENNWKEVLEEKTLLPKITHHKYDFSEKILLINNVLQEEEVVKKAQLLQERNVFTKIIIAPRYISEILSFFLLKREDFVAKDSRKEFQVTDDWIFFNALAPLAAIYFCQTPYLLYFTSDVQIPKPISWIEKALYWFERKEEVKIANLLWNGKYEEAKKEAYKKKGDFFFAKKGFSDQLFLVKTQDFQKPIYSQIRQEASHFPRGEVFEKRVFSHMLEHNWERLTYRKASYHHF